MMPRLVQVVQCNVATPKKHNMYELIMHDICKNINNTFYFTKYIYNFCKNK